MWLLLSSSTEDSGSKHTRWDPGNGAGYPGKFL
jgi:hypothetical protein